MAPIQFRSGDHYDTAARVDASQAKAVAREVSTETKLLRAEIDRLYLINEALWTVVRDAVGLDDQKLIDAMEEIDLRDGRLDGRAEATHAPDHCPNCRRTMLRHRPLCIYCGARVIRGPFDR
ncbi:MAG: hypothetical protein ACYTGQ_09830 [Planctomycetota bacterium]|jgi:hypothetical protein